MESRPQNTELGVEVSLNLLDCVGHNTFSD